MKQFLGLGNPKLNLPSWKFNPFEKYESSQNGVHLPQGYGWKIAKKYWSCHHQASFVTVNLGVDQEYNCLEPPNGAPAVLSGSPALLRSFGFYLEDHPT